MPAQLTDLSQELILAIINLLVEEDQAHVAQLEKEKLDQDEDLPENPGSDSQCKYQ